MRAFCLFSGMLGSWALGRDEEGDAGMVRGYMARLTP